MEVLALITKFLKRLKFELLKGSRLPVFAGLLATIFLFSVQTSNNPSIQALFNRLDNLIYDQRFSFMLETPKETEHKIVIIDIDQRSLESYGRWPWSRFDFGDLVRELNKYGVIVIGFDFFFPEPERNLMLELREKSSGTDIENDLPPDSQLEQWSKLLDGDLHYAEQMKLMDVVLGVSFKSGDTVRYGNLPESIIQLDEERTRAISFLRAIGYEGNVDILQNAASGVGFFDTLPDSDGVLRSTPLVMRYENNLYPSLPLEMMRLYLFEERFTIGTELDLTGQYDRLTGINVGQVFIPTDAIGQVLIPYAGKSNLGNDSPYTYISAGDVLTGNLTTEEQDALINSLALVGATATGLFDLRSAPMEAVFPGVEVHANVLNALLSAVPTFTLDNTTPDVNSANTLKSPISVLSATRDQSFPSKPDWEEGAVVATIIISGVFLSFIYPLLGPALLLLSSLSFMLGVTALNFKLWADYNLDISLIMIIFLILVITVINLTYGFLKEGLSRRAIKGMFDQYVPPAHIDAMLDDPDNYNFEGESKELSVLFSDIRGFTSISEVLSAGELKTLLNDFFTPITGIIFDYNGTIDKYVGDMVMAFWGAPINDPDHRLHSVQAALKMLEKVEELKIEFIERGLPEVNIGVGINSGFMNVGDMGSTYRRSYTVLGDAVNLGSRLESITKVYGVKLLIGEETFDHLEGYLCRLVDKVQVKGKDEPVRIYQPLCLEEEASEELLGLVDEYHRAYKQYVDQDWDAAVRMFENLKLRDPETKIYDVYLDRISDLREQDLEPDWDGTFRFTTK
jgi:adenylate cyclase